MNTLKGNQIKAAELIMEHCHTNGYVLLAKILGQNLHWGLEIRDLEDASEFLQDNVGFIKIDNTTKDGYLLLLTREGEQFKESGKTIREIVESESEKEAKRQAKEERDEHYKNLQVRDLEERLNTMNAMQRDFWKAQKAKNKQTTLIAIINVLFSLVALMKAWGFFD